MKDINKNLIILITAATIIFSANVAMPTILKGAVKAVQQSTEAYRQ
tara:strand:+ start:929 stop:1066 length:138 start_codon:yes stop_codon:yes gene_type:complete